MSTSFSRRWRISLPFVLALFTLVALILTASLAWTNPYDGIESLYPTGEVGAIAPGSPADGKLLEGDIVKSVDGIPWDNAYNTYLGKHGGDQVEVIVERNGQLEKVNFTLADPPLEKILIRLVPILVALVFWGIGLGVQAFTPADSAAVVFFYWCQAIAVMLAAGAASQGPLWVSGLFNFMLWLVGPLSVHFHLRFPQNLSIRFQRYGLFLLYFIAVAAGIVFLFFGTNLDRSAVWFSQLLSIQRFFLALNLLLVVFLLVYAYRNATSSGVRGKIRIVALGGGLSALLLVTLTILPDALLKQAFLPYSFAFLLLGVLPMTYGYAIFRHRLIEIEQHVNRGATYILVFSTLGAFYLILYAVAHELFSRTMVSEPVINTILVLILASVYQPLKRTVQRLVDTVFYGGWYDYRSAITEITQGLEQVTDLNILGRTVGERLRKTLRLEDACVFLRDLEGDFSVIQTSSQADESSDHQPLSFSVLPRTSLAYLLKIGAVERNTLREQLSEVVLTPEEHQLLNSEQVNLWVPVIGHGEVQGLLALGPKMGGDIFSGEDLDILRLVTRQVGPVIENIHLVTRLREYAVELEKRVEERTAELHESKERVEAILASVGDGVVVTDLEGRILTMNNAFEEQSGYQAQDLVGQVLFEMLGGYNPSDKLEEIRSTLDRSVVWSGELVNQRKNGRQYDILLTIAPVRDQKGNLVSYVGSQHDITRQKELDRLKDRFVSDVSHELRTPTTNISLFLELMENAPEEKRSEFLTVLKNQSQLLKKLVEDILDLSRLAVGKVKKPEFQPVDLNLIADQVITAHKPFAESHGLSLEFLPDSDLPLAFGVQNQISRVVTNLVANAVQYTPEGKVVVETSRSNGRIGLSVTDTGMGIDPDDLPHLFERFYRGKQVSQSKTHGTGLGLAIVKEILELHEGNINISSELGKGSTFKIWLPMPEEEVVNE